VDGAGFTEILAIARLRGRAMVRSLPGSPASVNATEYIKSDAATVRGGIQLSWGVSERYAAHARVALRKRDMYVYMLIRQILATNCNCRL